MPGSEACRTLEMKEKWTETIVPMLGYRAELSMQSMSSGMKCDSLDDDGATGHCSPLEVLRTCVNRRGLTVVPPD